MRGLGAEARSALRGAELPCPTWWSRQEESGGGKDERGGGAEWGEVSPGADCCFNTSPQISLLEGGGGCETGFGAFACLQ